MKIQGTALLKRTLESKAKIVIQRGGSSSSKTYSLAQYMIIQALQEKQIISVYRQSLPSIRKSVYRDFEKIFDSLQLWREVRSYKTELRFVFKKTGAIIEFVPADDPARLRGPRRQIAWINEATEVGYESFRQIALRSDRVFLVWNPSDEEFWGNKKLEIERAQAIGDVEVIVSNYLSNPFLSESQVQEIEGLRPVYKGDKLISGDDNFFRVYGLGEYGYFAGRIFNNFEIVDQVPDQDHFYLGLDFGYQNDPTAIIEVAKDGKTLWVHEALYKKEQTNHDLAAFLARYNRRPVYCDAAEPKSIKELKVLGINARPGRKGPDSLLQGIQHLQQYEIKITSSSENVISEFQKYCWTFDTNGNPTNKPIDKYNNSIDALRYVLSKIGLKQKIRIT